MLVVLLLSWLKIWRPLIEWYTIHTHQPISDLWHCSVTDLNRKHLCEDSESLFPKGIPDTTKTTITWLPILLQMWLLRLQQFIGIHIGNQQHHMLVIFQAKHLSHVLFIVIVLLLQHKERGAKVCGVIESLSLFLLDDWSIFNNMAAFNFMPVLKQRYRCSCNVIFIEHNSLCP